MVNAIREMPTKTRRQGDESPCLLVYTLIERLALHLVHELPLRLKPANPIKPVASSISMAELALGFSEVGWSAVTKVDDVRIASDPFLEKDPSNALPALEYVPPIKMKTIRNIKIGFFI